MGQNMRRLLIIGGSVFAVIVVALVTLYILGGRTPQGQQAGILQRLASGFGSITEGLTPPPVAQASEFVFRRLEIDTSKPEAEACFVFTRDLDASGKTHYEDYFAIDPAVKTAMHVVDSRLCVSGLSFNTTYNVTLKAGLPDAAGDKMADEETVPVELRDKPSVVRFTGGIVLPRDNAQGVPVTTVNISKLRVKLIKVGDRLLSQIESGVVDQTSLYQWNDNELETSQGKLVWQGTMDVAVVKNDSVVTLIPINTVLKDKKPGAYVLLAMDAAKKTDTDNYYESEDIAAQWVIDSDIALTTFKGAGGMSVFARSYASAKPLSGVKLSLVARDNNELASVTTDASGRADFDQGLMTATGGEEPVVVMAYAGDDFSFLDLRRPAFDLTDRGVSGRETPGPVDAFLYTERGVYRPGEVVQAAAMLRDRVAAAVSAPLTLIATRPDGLEFARITVPGASLAAGTATWPLQLSKTAPHGRWQIAAYVDTSKNAPAVGRVQFDVQDFVPQKLKVTLTALTKVAHPNSDIVVRAETRFLYGAPGSGLSGEGQARIVADPKPFADYEDWQFGRVDDSFSDVEIAMKVPDSDPAGVTEARATIGELADTTLPLKAMIKVSIHEPGGRTTSKTVDIPLRTRDVMIGIRPDFDGSAVPENSRAAFEAVAINADGKRIALSGLTYSWVKVETTYQWFQEGAKWKYKSVTRDRLVTSGSMALGLGAAAKLSQVLPWGDYRLTISDPKSGAASSYSFWSGWAAEAANDRPDRIPVAADKPSYRAGETAKVTIKPNANGKALVVVAGDRIFSSQLVDTSAGGTSVSLPVSADWGPGAYVLVTQYKPLNEASGREPVRSIGLTWLALDNSPRTLTASIGGPAKITPRQKLVIPVTIKGLDSGEDAYLTLAAVDEGILQLTDYKSPDPNTYYFGKRRLGVDMRDDYGRLIKAENGAVGSLREGGDSFGGRSLSVVPVKTVSLFSGLVKIGANGTANVPIDVPDFNGELRLMVVAFAKDKLGHADRPLTVRDPVVADLVLPRFLAPGDRALAALNLNNVEGKDGNYTAVVTATAPLMLNASARVTRPLNTGQRILVPVEIGAGGIGISSVKLTVTGPGGFNVSHDWQIQTRAPQLDVARDDTVAFGPNQSYTANKALVADIIPGTQNVALTVSAAHGFNNVPGLLKWLDKYPYGCIEQTTSRAMPLLVFNDLADLAGLPRDKALHDREQQAIDAVLDMQNYAGNFGMWGPGDDAEPWISVFALDFLNQARAKGYVVPNDALRRGASWLKTTSTSDADDPTRAYAFYVLAKTGQVNISDLRYFADTRLPEMTGAIAAALTGAAAADIGDRARAVTGFEKAREIMANADPARYAQTDYGSLLRDVAGSTALAAESGEAQLIPAFLAKSDQIDMRLNATTTQEKAWMLRAAYELTRQRTPLNILVNGRPGMPRDGSIRLAPSYGQLSAGLTLVNKGDATVWRTVSVQGTPALPLPPMANGLTLNKSVWTMSGTPADLNGIRQNDRVLVVLSGQMPNNYYHQMGVIDLLPAGLEIELKLAGDDGKPYPWIGGTLADMRMSDSRDDRYVGAFDIGAQYRPSNSKKPEPQPSFRVAYIARAVTTGDFVMPAGVVEDMYAPGVMARTEMKRITIKP
ncbi:MAG: alpha-2-macroglobulin family protein [Alphaproteobacteria bacterium]|nr:alpha-2-macroglobulin family protein [Alphaproteobacteria bacterium]